MKTVVFTFGRMNPPTKGHARLIETVVKTAQDLDADHVVYLSQTQRSPTDPLDWKTKRQICKLAFPDVWFSDDKDIKNPFLALELLKDHYEKVILVAGADQIADYERFRPYVLAWGISFELVSAGERTKSNRGISGISATLLRKYAEEGKKEKFFEGLPNTINSNVKELVFKKTVNGLKGPKKK